MLPQFIDVFSGKARQKPEKNRLHKKGHVIKTHPSTSRNPADNSQ